MKGKLIMSQPDIKLEINVFVGEDSIDFALIKDGLEVQRETKYFYEFVDEDEPLPTRYEVIKLIDNSIDYLIEDIKNDMS
jgi:hypothetical protein